MLGVEVLLAVLKIEAGAERWNIVATMYLANAGTIAVRIFQHLVDELHLDGTFLRKQVDVFGLVLTEQILNGPCLMALFIPVGILFRVLRLIKVRPVEHLHILGVLGSHNEHGEGCSIWQLCQRAVGGDRVVFGILRLLFRGIATGHHRCQHYGCEAQ